MRKLIVLAVFTLLNINIGFGETVIGQNVGDNFGISESGIGDFNGDGCDDYAVGAPGVGVNNAGAVYIYFYCCTCPILPVNPNPDIIISGLNANEALGSSVSGNFDINGDGFKDIIAGAPGWNGNVGRAYVFFGTCGVPNFPTNLSVNDADIVINGEASATVGFGFKVSKAGDFNGDCLDDVMISSPWLNNSYGRVYILYGIRNYPSSNTPIQASSSTITKMSGRVPSGLFGFSISDLGDIGNCNTGIHDYIDDIIIGAPLQGEDTGRVYVYYGSCSKDTIADRMYMGQSCNGSSCNDDFGISVSGLGDINGNGWNDFIVGDYRYPIDARGSAYVYDGSVIPSVIVFTANTLKNITGESSTNNDGRFGQSVAGIGDYDGDRFNDFIIGARGWNGYMGREYFFPSNCPAVIPGTPAGTGSFAIRTGTGVDNVGFSSSWVGDLNGNGRNDLMFGAFSADEGLGVTGAAYIDHAPTLPRTYTTVYLKAFIQGYYQGGNTQIASEVTVCLYDSLCQLIDERNVLLAANGNAYTKGEGTLNLGVRFNNLPPPGVNSTRGYYIAIKGLCNSSVSTWSSTRVSLYRGGNNAGNPYDFTTNANKAYGNNQVLVSPGVYAIYNGDVNGDCVIDLDDLVEVFNDAANFTCGGCCLKTDVNGDGCVDLSDVTQIYNNSADFVHCESPCSCPCP